MSQTLVVVESPVKAEKIQSFLGSKYKVVASMGHIADLGRGGTSNTGVDILNNFKPRYILLEDKVKTFSNILNEANNSDLVLVAADGDREGEAIAWHVATRLAGISAPIKRMVFNEIKKKTILKAVKNVREIDMNLFQAQETRRILDRLVGFMASPFLMNTLGPKLSAGRVQSVVTRMIVERENDINVFIPENFWTVDATVKFNNDIFNIKFAGRPTTKKEADDIVTKAKSGFIVSEIIKKPEKVMPPAPLVTSTLQRLMSKKFGMSADKTMKAAQSLYELGYCTYIRTDSVRCSEESLSEVRDYIKNNYTVPKQPNVFKNKNASQDAHECIRPSDISLKPDNGFILTDPDQKKVYEMIWKYFVASQMNPAVYNTVKVTCKTNSDNKVLFKSSGKVLSSKGYLEVLGVKDNGKIDIPNINVGDALIVNKVDSNKKQTQPPPRYSEDKLIKELEIKNIGRPATYADLLSKISIRNYVEKKGSVFYPTDLGKKVTESLANFFSFMDYNYTADLELKLDKIESGELDKNKVLSEFFLQFQKQLQLAYTNNGINLCPKCGSAMIEMTNKTTGEKFNGCTNYKQCI